MRSRYVGLSFAAVLAVLGAFGLHIYSFDYKPVAKSKGTVTNAAGEINLTVGDKGLTAIVEPSEVHVRGNGCLLHLRVQNRNAKEVTFLPEQCEYILEVVGGSVSRDFDLKQGNGISPDSLIRTIPARSGHLTSPFVSITFDIFDFVGTLPPADYRLRLRLKLATSQGGTANLSTNMVRLLLPVGGKK
ncbi:MAG: hypothetical protein Kow00107_03370 [Planctomycetota bacterium]